MAQNFFVGVDGGGTKSIVRLEDEAGHLLGQEIGGPANIRISVTQTWESINHALEKILRSSGLSLDSGDFHAGMGLAGCELTSAYQAFLKQSHPFKTLVVTSDAHTACLGAHNARDGAIIIIGTGVVGYQIQEKQSAKVSGWGFPYDDEGGGAWLGLEAVKHTLQCLDGRVEKFSKLAEVIYAYFATNVEHLLTWANQANSTAYATLAPLVIQQSEKNDPAAITLLQLAGQAIDRIATALQAAQCKPDSILPCTLIGGLAPFVQPYLNAPLRARLQSCYATPDVGAIKLIKNSLLRIAGEVGGRDGN